MKINASRSKSTIMVESYPKCPPKMARVFIYKRLRTRRLTKAEEADNSTRKLPTLPQRLARAHHISRSTLKIIISNRPILNNFRTKKKLLLPSSIRFRKKESPPSKMLTATLAEFYKVLFSFYITGKKILD